MGLDGQVVVRRFEDFANNKSWQEVTFESAGRKITLVPSTEDALAGAVTGDAHLAGHWLADEIFEVTELEGSAVAAQALATPAPQKRTALVLMVNFSDDARQPIPLGKAKADLIGGLDSVNGYLKEASFGLRELVGKANAGGDVYGYYTLASPKSPCDPDRWKREALAAASAAGIGAAGYQHVMMVFPSSDQCGWGGLGEVGGSFSWFPHPYFTYSVPHELGHNLGLSHANAFDCRGPNGGRVAISDNCTSREYADPFCAMGGNVRHFSNYAKGRVGWLSDANVQTLTQGQSTAAIFPIETASGGVQVVRVYKDSPNGRARYYYLEYRRPNAGWDNFGPSLPVVNGVTIRLAQDFNRGDVTNLIDTTPGTDNYGDAPLAVGKSFRDERAKLTITTVSADALQASVRVEYDAAAATRAPAGNGSGLQARYFNEKNFTAPAIARLEPAINFEWGAASPDASIQPDTFSARLTGQLLARDTGVHSFFTTSDDGVRLWVNGQLVIDNWTPHPPTENTGTISLEAGKRYDVKLEYYEEGGGSTLRLEWKPPAQPREVTPTAQLFPAG